MAPAAPRLPWSRGPVWDGLATYIKIANALRHTQTGRARRLSSVPLLPAWHVDAWIVHLVFENDPTLTASDQTDEDTWRSELEKIETRLGLDEDVPWHASIILPGRP
jgi:hypothetical protein